MREMIGTDTPLRITSGELTDTPAWAPTASRSFLRELSKRE
jgi:hypothetical protein